MSALYSLLRGWNELKVKLVKFFLGTVFPLPSYLILSLLAFLSFLMSYSFLTWFPTNQVFCLLHIQPKILNLTHLILTTFLERKPLHHTYSKTVLHQVGLWHYKTYRIRVWNIVQRCYFPDIKLFFFKTLLDWKLVVGFYSLCSIYDLIDRCNLCALIVLPPFVYILYTWVTLLISIKFINYKKNER